MSALLLDLAAGGSFQHLTAEKGHALLDRIQENAPHLKPVRVEPEPRKEDVSSASAEQAKTLERPSPEPKPEMEESMDLPSFEDELFEDLGNTSKYQCHARPPIPVTPSEPLDETFSRSPSRS